MKTFLAVAAAALIASAGTATASSWVNGHQIKRHSIPLNRLVGKVSTPGFTKINGPTVSLSPGEASGDQAHCPAGTRAISGGYRVTADAPWTNQYVVDDSEPSDTLSEWDVGFINQGPGDIVVQVYAICAS